MEAVDFMREACRMCKEYTKLQCQGCPLLGSGCHFSVAPDNPESIERISAVVNMVEKWSKSNPQKTRLMAFLEVFPNASLLNGVPFIDPCDVEGDYGDGNQ